MRTRWHPLVEACAVVISYCAVSHALYDLAPATLFTTIPLGLFVLDWLD